MLLIVASITPFKIANYIVLLVPIFMVYKRKSIWILYKTFCYQPMHTISFPFNIYTLISVSTILIP